MASAGKELQSKRMSRNFNTVIRHFLRLRARFRNKTPGIQA